jgi:hypothetical protein
MAFMLSARSAPDQKHALEAPWDGWVLPILVVDRLRDLDRVTDFDAEIANGALDLGMPEQELYRSQIACASVVHRGRQKKKGKLRQYLAVSRTETFRYEIPLRSNVQTYLNVKAQ